MNNVVALRDLQPSGGKGWEHVFMPRVCRENAFASALDLMALHNVLHSGDLDHVNPELGTVTVVDLRCGSLKFTIEKPSALDPYTLTLTGDGFSASCVFDSDAHLLSASPKYLGLPFNPTLKTYLSKLNGVLIDQIASLDPDICCGMSKLEAEWELAIKDKRDVRSTHVVDGGPIPLYGHFCRQLATELPGSMSKVLFIEGNIQASDIPDAVRKVEDIYNRHADLFDLDPKIQQAVNDFGKGNCHEYFKVLYQRAFGTELLAKPQTAAR